MKTLIHEHVLTIKTETGEIVDVIRNESYVLSPEKGKVLRDKRTGFLSGSDIGIGSKDFINDYEEIDM